MKKLLLLLLFLSTVAHARGLDFNPVGQSMTVIVDAIGYPTRTFEAPGGVKVYAYELGSSGTTPQFTTPGTSQTTVVGRHAFTTNAGGGTWGGVQWRRWCNAYFEVDDKDVVTKWRWQGNACW